MPQHRNGEFAVQEGYWSAGRVTPLLPPLRWLGFAPRAVQAFARLAASSLLPGALESGSLTRGQKASIGLFPVAGAIVSWVQMGSAGVNGLVQVADRLPMVRRPGLIRARGFESVRWRRRQTVPPALRAIRDRAINAVQLRASPPGPPGSHGRLSNGQSAYSIRAASRYADTVHSGLAGRKPPTIAFRDLLEQGKEHSATRRASGMVQPLPTSVGGGYQATAPLAPARELRQPQSTTGAGGRHFQLREAPGSIAMANQAASVTFARHQDL